MYNKSKALVVPKPVLEDPCPAHFVCLPNQTHPCNQGVLDKRDIQKVQGRGPPGQVWEPLL